jgi:hypothetical protein
MLFVPIINTTSELYFEWSDEKIPEGRSFKTSGFDGLWVLNATDTSNWPVKFMLNIFGRVKLNWFFRFTRIASNNLTSEPGLKEQQELCRCNTSHTIKSRSKTKVGWIFNYLYAWQSQQSILTLIRRCVSYRSLQFQFPVVNLVTNRNSYTSTHPRYN